MAGDYYMYNPMGTSSNYTITYYPITYPRHPGCPGKKHTCPDCGQEYFAPTPYVPQPIWPSWQPNIVYSSGIETQTIPCTATYGSVDSTTTVIS